MVHRAVRIDRDEEMRIHDHAMRHGMTAMVIGLEGLGRIERQELHRDHEDRRPPRFPLRKDRRLTFWMRARGAAACGKAPDVLIQDSATWTQAPVAAWRTAACNALIAAAAADIADQAVIDFLVGWGS